MKKRTLVTLMLTLALAAANAAPLSAVVTCVMNDGGGGGCACDPGACCSARTPAPGETPAGPGLDGLCCLVTLPDAAPVETAPAPPSTSVENAPLAIVVAPITVAPASDSHPAPALAADPPPEESPPRYALHCAYLI